MPERTPAAASTATSAPSAFIRLTVSGVPATRGSAGLVSAAIAIFMRACRTGRLDEKISHQDQNDDDGNDAPFHQREEALIGRLVGRIVVARSGCVFDGAVLGHSFLQNLGVWVAQMAASSNARPRLVHV